jgi:hypothetical protein
MGFQIKDKEGNAIPINELDKEAAEFWGKTPDDKYYANPMPEPLEDATLSEKVRAEGSSMAMNWFDNIGWNIANPGNYTSGWNNVKVDLWQIQIASCVLKENKVEVLEYVGYHYDYIELFLDLIDHWAEKGYTPHKVED